MFLSDGAKTEGKGGNTTEQLKILNNGSQSSLRQSVLNTLYGSSHIGLC